MKAILINSNFLCVVLILVFCGTAKGQEYRHVNFFHVLINVPNERGILDRNSIKSSYFPIGCNPFVLSGDSLLVKTDLILSGFYEGFVLIEYSSPINNVIFSQFAVGYLSQDLEIPFYSLLDSDRNQKIFSISYDQILNEEGTNIQYSNDFYRIVYSCFGQESVEIYKIQKYRGLVCVPVKSKWECY